MDRSGYRHINFLVDPKVRKALHQGVESKRDQSSRKTFNIKTCFFRWTTGTAPP